MLTIFFHNESVEGEHLLFGTKFYVYVDLIFVHLKKKKKMASEQIAALTKTLTESLITQQKAQIDFQKQMLVQQERFEALVIQQTTDN